jgi:GNAT superfamily N-acetyltransferase
VDDATLARLEHENLLEWMRLAFGQAAGGLVDQDGGVGIFATGLAHPFFNQILTDVGATAPELTRSIQRVRERGQAFYVVIRDPQDAGFAQLLADLGLWRDAERLPGMAVEPIRDPGPVPQELHIRVVADAAGLADHARALAGFGFPDEFVVPYLGDELWLVPDTTTYVGYAGGEPVVSGFAVRTGRAIGVYSISTLPAARRRGYGAAMTERILADGVAAGCDVGILQASSMGRPIYERLGFRLVQEYAVFGGKP